MEAFIKQFSLKIAVSEAVPQRCYKASFTNSRWYGRSPLNLLHNFSTLFNKKVGLLLMFLNFEFIKWVVF